MVEQRLFNALMNIKQKKLQQNNNEFNNELPSDPFKDHKDITMN